MSEKRCIAIKAFWRDNDEGGFCIEFHELTEGSLDLAVEKIDQLIIKIAESDPHKDIDAMNEYFIWVGKNKDVLSAPERMRALTMVAYAEEQGLIESDEYNGMMYLFQQDGSIIVDRKDK